MFLFWVLVIVLIIALLRGSRFRRWEYMQRHYHGQADQGKALDILNERYAKGEISKEEYEAKKNDITK